MFGKGQDSFDLIGPGLVVGAERRYNFLLYQINNRTGTDNANIGGRMVADLNGDGAPDEFRAGGGVDISFSEQRQHFLVDKRTVSEQLGNNIYPIYNGAGQLTPRDRAHRFILFNPESLNYLTIGGGGAVSANSNTAEGTLLFRGMKGLKGLIISTTRLSRIANFPLNLTFFQINADTSISDFPKIPEKLKTIVILNLSQATNIGSRVQAVDTVENLEFATDSFSQTNYLSTFTSRTTNVGALDISSLTNLKRLILVKDATLTLSATNNLTYLALSELSTFNQTAALEYMLTNINWEVFYISDLPGMTWAKNFVDSDFKSTSQIFECGSSGITGDITATTARPNLWRVMLGTADKPNDNNFGAVNISGFTAMIHCQMLKCGVTSLELPVTTTPEVFRTWDLGINDSNSPAFKSVLEGYSNLKILTLLDLQGPFTNFSMASYTQINDVLIQNSGFNGTITMPSTQININVFTIQNEPGVTSIANFAVQTTINNLKIQQTGADINYSTLLSCNSFTSFLNPNQIGIDLSNENSGAYSVFLIGFNASLTGVTLPSNPVAFNTSLRIESNGSLLTVNNLSNVSLSNSRAIVIKDNTSLNFTVNFGGSMVPTNIQLNGNAIDQANVDNIVDTIYAARLSMNSGAKLLFLQGGTNAVPSGTFQAPPGFVLGSADGTPTSPQERLYVLVNNYSWTVTTN